MNLFTITVLHITQSLNQICVVIYSLQLNLTLPAWEHILNLPIIYWALAVNVLFDPSRTLYPYSVFYYAYYVWNFTSINFTLVQISAFRSWVAS
jgi:hypothetical protein